MKRIALSPQVIRELEQDRTLMALWCLGRRIDSVDPDIDPVFNPDWCRTRIAKELALLSQLKRELAELGIVSP